MSKKLFLRILHVCIRIAVCGLGCMMLTAAIAVVAAPDQSLTQAASKSFLQNETPLLKDQPDFSPEEAVLWKKSSYGAAGYSRMIPAHYFPLFPAVAAKANFSPLMQFILQSGACILIAAGGFIIRRTERSSRLKFWSKYLLTVGTLFFSILPLALLMDLFSACQARIVLPVLAVLFSFLVLLIKTAADRRSFIRNAERTIASEKKPDYLQIPDALTIRTTKEFCKGYFSDFAVVAKRFLLVAVSILGFLFAVNLLLSGPLLFSGI